ncbi:hypothetical protein ACFL5W_01035 [Thermodesulfobacteriota bacterium]
MGINTNRWDKLRNFGQGVATAIVLVLFLSLTGCGGSGGSSTQADADLQYSGVTTPAVIDAANADQLAGEALEAGGTGSSLGMMEAAQIDEAASHANLRSINLPLNLKSVVGNNDSTLLPMIINGVWIRHTGTLTDTCGFGGYVDYDKSYENNTGEFTATYWFYDYCDKGSLINGVVSSSGFVNPADPNELLTATQRFKKLTDGSATLSGWISVNAVGSPVVIVFDALIRDETTHKVYWIKEYTLRIWESADYIEVDVSGTFYNPDLGFVRLTTDAILEIANADEYPRAGALVIEGAGGAEIKLTAIDNATCLVEADTDGDDVYDVTIGPIGWDEL